MSTSNSIPHTSIRRVEAPFGKLEPLAVLKTNPDGAGIVQAIGPLKGLAGNDPELLPRRSDF